MSTPELPSNSKKPNARKKQAALSDTRLIQAALELIAESGIERVTLRSIGERAGYSRGLVNYRFGTKEALLRKATRRLVQNWIEELQSLNDGQDLSGLPTIELFLDNHRQNLIENRPEFRAYHALMYSALGPMRELRQELAQVHAASREEISSWIQAGIDNGEIHPDLRPVSAAIWIDGAARGIAYQWYMEPEAIDIEQTFADLLTAIRRSLTRPPT